MSPFDYCLLPPPIACEGKDEHAVVMAKSSIEGRLQASLGSRIARTLGDVQAPLVRRTIPHHLLSAGTFDFLSDHIVRLREPESGGFCPTQV